MFKKFYEFFINGIKNIFNNTAKQVNIINEKYRTPHTSSKPVVRIALVVLRVYLMALIVIIVYKFIIVVITGKAE
ncbi:MAG: hypothetical protein Q8903_06810 [Bacteroidota bacterium]|nr:hypothetical protein [Bacteroidota bacterium]